jgi:signal peptidase I
MAGRHWLRNHAEAVLRVVLLLLVLVLIVRRWVCCPILITGNSMLPTLRSGQLALLNKLAYRFRPPERGDIVSLWTGGELWTKRVLGLPGEEIEIRRGTIYVNGSPLREPYVRFNDSADIAPGKLGANRFVVAGDNRGPALIVVVSRERIVGRLMFVRKSQ